MSYRCWQVGNLYCFLGKQILLLCECTPSEFKLVYHLMHNAYFVKLGHIFTGLLSLFGENILQ